MSQFHWFLLAKKTKTKELIIIIRKQRVLIIKTPAQVQIKSKITQKLETMTTHLLLRRCCAPPAIAGVRRPDRRRSLNPPIIPNIWRRRTLILLSLSPIPTLIPAAAQPSPEDLKPYADRAEGFELLVPESWTKVEKAGATALFEEKGKGSNNIGVVVNPVRLSSLRDFGSPEFVAEKLIQAERKKVKF